MANNVRFFFAHALESLPMDTKLHVFVCQTFAHHSYPRVRPETARVESYPSDAFESGQRVLCLTAKELKDALRKTLDDSDRILVVEVCAGWASRRAENNLGDLLPPRGGPALTLWKQRWGE